MCGYVCVCARLYIIYVRWDMELRNRGKEQVGGSKMNFSRPHYLKPKLTTTPTSSCSRLSNNVSSNVPSCSPVSLPYTFPGALFHLKKRQSILSFQATCTYNTRISRYSQEYRAWCLLPVKTLSSNNNSITSRKQHPLSLS